ncbi:DUF1566 domain-containing protein [Desulfurivibrio sp. C05AmB]|uniref:Lcl C-terminal domain-containing protein n=1 Tax=Desulfurivibrio sp. C05AmB TaxID=3374371 RepID=UPI00376EE2F1
MSLGKVFSLVLLATVALLLMLPATPVEAQVLCRDTNSSVEATTPSADFTQHGDGTVTHHITGLMWMRCSLGQSWDGDVCSGNAELLAWPHISFAVERFNAEGGFAGHEDWRMPTRDELVSIVEHRCASPSINGIIFPNTPRTRFLTASAEENDKSKPWYVYFDNGYVGKGYVGARGAIRLVRTVPSEK